MQEPTEPPLPEQPDTPLPVEGFKADSAEEDQGPAWFAQQWLGPLPSPVAVSAYEKLYPGAAEQLFKQHMRQGNHRMEMERQESNHRMEMEQQKQAHERKAQTRVQWMVFILVSFALVVSWQSDIIGNLAAGLVTLPIAGLPVVYITVSWWRKRKWRLTQDPSPARLEDD